MQPENPAEFPVCMNLNINDEKGLGRAWESLKAREKDQEKGLCTNRGNHILKNGIETYVEILCFQFTVQIECVAALSDNAVSFICSL